MSGKYIFVGERQSPTASARGWTWADGRLCAATLHRALRAAGIQPEAQRWCNLWSSPGLGTPTEDPLFNDVHYAVALGCQVVALGCLVSRALERANIPHTRLRHPAARGAGRARASYDDHVRLTLCARTAVAS